MKRTVLIAFMVFGIVALVFAQNNDNPRRGWGMGPGFGQGFFMGPRGPRNDGESAPEIVRENVTISGQLTITQGALTIKSGETTYYAMGLGRFIGFIDSLKEGAMVSLEGTAFTNPRDANAKFLWPTKLTIAGKDYEVGPPVPERTERPARPERTEPRQPRARER